MRRTEHVVLQLVSAFDNAQRAFALEARPGWVRASADLREALGEAREIGDIDLEAAPGWARSSEALRAALNDARGVGDVDTLPCPLSWWVACQASVRTWLEAPSADVRRGLSEAVNANIRALSKYASGEIALAPAPHGRGVE
jgi:hypothetical protein